jgi:hypothetical protein
MFQQILNFLNNDLVKAACIGAAGIVGSWYSLKSDLRSLQEGQQAFKEQIGIVMSVQEKRDINQDERINNLSKEIAENNREIRSDLRDLRSDIRNRR